MNPIQLAARELAAHVKQLERRVRAEEQAPFAELHDLFEAARSLDRTLDEVGPLRTACAMATCPIEGTEEVIKDSGQKHCTFHAQQLRTLMGAKAS
jgi:hypothetical protein